MVINDKMKIRFFLYLPLICILLSISNPTISFSQASEDKEKLRVLFVGIESFRSDILTKNIDSCVIYFYKNKNILAKYNFSTLLERKTQDDNIFLDFFIVSGSYAIIDGISEAPIVIYLSFPKKKVINWLICDYNYFKSLKQIGPKIIIEDRQLLFHNYQSEFQKNYPQGCGTKY